MRIGWLADPPGPIIGGAELSEELLRRNAPGWAEVVYCPPDQVVDCDAYVVHNCVRYQGILPLLRRRPVIRWVHDYWPHGDPELREWTLQNARVAIFDSEPHYRAFPYPVGTRVKFCPEPMDLAPFVRAGQVASEDVGERGVPLRSGVFWMGQMFAHKGVAEAVRWAEQNGPVDFYGDGPQRPVQSPNVRYLGQAPYEWVPDIMARYESFLHLPQWVEPFGRTVIEAAAAGCKLIVNDRVGAMWWLENEPDAIEQAIPRFWKIVKDALQ